MNVQAEIEL